MTPSFPTRRSSDLTKTVKSSISESVRVRDNATTTSHRLTHRIALAGSMVMVVTMIHHAYGAWAYDAPWRRHVVPIAAALIAAMMVLARYGNAPSARAALVALVARKSGGVGKSGV